MKRRRPFPIAWKLTLTILLATTPVLLLGMVVFAARTARELRVDLQRQVIRSAEMVADYTAPELAFGYTEQSTETLSRLQHDPHVLGATLYDREGRVFATYQRPGAELGVWPDPARLPLDAEPGLRTEWQHIDVLTPVTHQGDRLGTLHVLATTAGLQARMVALLASLIPLALVLALVAVVWAVLVQRGVSRPILELSSAARRLAEQGDYSLRVPPRGDRELVDLAEVFNSMVGAVEARQLRSERAEAAQRRTAETLRIVGQIQERALAGHPVTGVASEGLRDLVQLLQLEAAHVLELSDDKGVVLASYPPEASRVGRSWLVPKRSSALRELTERGFWRASREQRAPRFLALGCERADGHIALSLRAGPDLLGVLVLCRGSGAPTQVLERYAASEVAEALALALRHGRLLHENERHTAELERRVAERTAKLAAREAAYRLVITNADGLIVVDGAGAILFTNPAADELLGLEGGEPGQHRLEQTLRSGEVVEFTVTMPDESERRLSARAEAIDWEGEPCVAASIRDVTERRALEEQLLQTQKMAVVGRLAGGIAHDFNNVLMAMMGSVEMACNEEGLTPGVLRYLEGIQASVERGSALTRKLLNFSRRRRADLQDLELASFVEGLRDLFGRLLGEGVRLGLELPERPLWVRADPSDLEQVLINLIANARDAVGPNGQVLLAVELGTGGAWGAIVVRDDGPGIPPEIIPHIFEPFYTTKGIGEGTGLGLAIVYGIVERLGGTVMARNGLDEGAVFTITLPLIEEPVVSDPDIAILPEPEEIQGEGRTVLVVDDDEVIRSLIQEQLRTVGFQVFTAPDGDSALELAASLPQAPELLLTDMRMPGMDGMELVKRLQERQPDLRYLYMTGFGDDIIAAHGSDGPPANLIEKPFRLPTLLAAMEAVMKPPRARRRRQARRTRKPET